jgi:hypothetical protein
MTNGVMTEVKTGGLEPGIDVVVDVSEGKE